MIAPKTIMISAGELSADNYAADLVVALKKKWPEAKIFGIGSIASRRAGMDVRLDMSDVSTVGIIEPLRYLPKLLKSLFQVKRMLREERPDIFIPIDNQGFHMMCCKQAKALGIPVYYFISPQHWHWGTIKQGKQVAQFVNKVFAIFPQEADFYSRCGVDVSYVGHPCTDRVRPFRNKIKKDPILAVFPGSRKQEIERLLPVFLKVATLFCQSQNLSCV